MPDSPPRSALEFAFERFGQRVAPDAVDGWLRTPVLQNKQLRNGMGVIVIRDSGVIVFGAADYTAWGFPPSRPRSEFAAFMAGMLCRPATEHWLAATFAKAGCPAGKLHLNRPGDAINSYYDAATKAPVSVRHAEVAEIARALRDAGVSSAVALRMLYLGRDVIAEDVDQTSPQWAAYEKACAAVPLLPVLADRMTRAGIRPGDIMTVLETEESA